MTSEMLKSAAAQVRSDLRELDERWAALARERDEIEAAPLPPDDFAAMIVETIEHAARGYRDQLHADLSRYAPLAALSFEHAAATLSGIALCTGQPPALAKGGLPLEGRGLSLNALWFYFGDIVGPKLREAIAAMPDYPASVGLPRAERAEKIREIDAQLAELEADRAAVWREIREAGLDVGIKDDRTILPQVRAAAGHAG